MNLQQILDKLNEPTKKYSKKQTGKYIKQYYDQVGEDLRTGKASYLGININDFK